MILLLLLTHTGCGKEKYSFQQSVDEIETIEIVSAENSLAFTVIKTLSETEKNEFLEQFQTIPFHTYYFGDPMTVYGNAVRIAYQNGDYEMICSYWAEYVKNGEIYFGWKNCDQKDFHELLDGFLE